MDAAPPLTAPRDLPGEFLAALAQRSAAGDGEFRRLALRNACAVAADASLLAGQSAVHGRADCLAVISSLAGAAALKAPAGESGVTPAELLARHGHAEALRWLVQTVGRGCLTRRVRNAACGGGEDAVLRYVYEACSVHPTSGRRRTASRGHFKAGHSPLRLWHSIV